MDKNDSSSSSDESSSKANGRERRVMNKRPKSIGNRQINKRKFTFLLLDLHFKNYVNDKNTDFYKHVKGKFLYKPFIPLPDLSEYLNTIIEVRVASEYLSKTNKAYIEKRIWGSDIYTSDSDVVCILQHSGYFNIKDLSPTDIKGVSVYLRVSKSRAMYNSNLKFGIKSKKMTNFNGHSIKPENFLMLTSLGKL